MPPCLLTTPPSCRLTATNALQGKVLLLITNSDYVYTDTMMTYAYDPYLPEGRTWRDLFDMVIVQVSTSGVEMP